MPLLYRKMYFDKTTFWYRGGIYMEVLYGNVK